MKIPPSTVETPHNSEHEVWESRERALLMVVDVSGQLAENFLTRGQEQAGRQKSNQEEVDIMNIHTECLTFMYILPPSFLILV